MFSTILALKDPSSPTAICQSANLTFFCILRTRLELQQNEKMAFGYIRRPPLSYPAFSTAQLQVHRSYTVLYPLHMGSNLCVWSRTVCKFINCLFFSSLATNNITVNGGKLDKGNRSILILIFSILFYSTLFILLSMQMYLAWLKSVDLSLPSG